MRLAGQYDSGRRLKRPLRSMRVFIEWRFPARLARWKNAGQRFSAFL